MPKCLLERAAWNPAILPPVFVAFCGSRRKAGKTGSLTIENAWEPMKTSIPALADNSSDVIVILDSDRTGRYVSPSIKDVLGYYPWEIVSEPFRFFHPDDISIFVDAFDKTVNGPCRVISAEVRLYRVDGTYRLFEAVITNLLNHAIVKGIVTRFHEIDVNRFNDEMLEMLAKKLDVLAPCIPTGLFLVDLCGRCIYGDVRFQEITGLSQKEIEGFGWSRIIHPDDREKLLLNIALNTGCGGGSSAGFRIITPRGRPKWVFGKMSPALSGNGEKIGWCGTLDDFTEIRDAEVPRHENEKKHWPLFETVSEAVFICDAETLRFVDLNERAVNLYGYSRDEFLKMTNLDILAESEKSETEIWKVFEGKRTFVPIQYHRKKDGTIFPVEISSSTFKRGIQRFVVGLARDISRRMEAQKARNESEAKYKSIIDNIGIGVSLINPQMEIISINNNIRRWFPKTARLKGLKCYDAYNDPPKKEVCSYCPTIRTLQDGKVHEAVSRSMANGQIKNFRIVSSPVMDDNGDVIAAIEMVEDITEKIKMEKELLKQGKLESLAALAGGVAHDFNNILASLIGNVSLARKKVEKDTELYELIDEVDQAANRCVKLTRQLVTFSKGGAPSKKTMSIVDVIREAAEFVLHGSNVRCEYDLPGNLYPVDIDRDQISQVISNLVLNSVQSMPGGGTAKIEAGNTTLKKQSFARLGEGAYVRIAVEDTGAGIPEENREKIFDPFYTTKENHSGLGLYNCKRILQQHAGDIQVGSRCGAGTKFIIYLPASQQQVQVIEDLKEIDPVKNIKVLVMDDEEAMRRLHRRYMRELGFTVTLSSDGGEVVELYREALNTGQPFDVVILDLTIRGGMGGKETIIKLREIDEGVKAIVSSGYFIDPVMDDPLAYGFCGKITKPYDFDELAEVLRHVLYPNPDENK
jgi:PAS domain S-box-containing protein